MTQMVNDAEKDLQQLIVNHLKDHSRSGDTLLGIIRRVVCEAIDQATANVEKALNELVERGVVMSLPRPDGKVFFKIRN